VNSFISTFGRNKQKYPWPWDSPPLLYFLPPLFCCLIFGFFCLIFVLFRFIFGFYCCLFPIQYKLSPNVYKLRRVYKKTPESRRFFFCLYSRVSTDFPFLISSIFLGLVSYFISSLIYLNFTTKLKNLGGLRFKFTHVV